MNAPSPIRPRGCSTPGASGRAPLFRQERPPCRPLLLLCLFLALCGCAAKQERPGTSADAKGVSADAGWQLVLANGGPISDTELLRRLGKAEYVLVGERHDTARDHQVQAALLALLARNGKDPILGLEMLPRRRFSRELREFSEGRLGLEALPAALDWRQSWGFSFSLYEPVFAVAARYRVPVYGLNLPHAVRTKVSREGMAALAPAEKAELPGRVIPPLPEQREELAAFFVTHRTMLEQHKSKAGESRTRLAAERHPGRKPAQPLVVPVTVRGVRDGRPASAVVALSVEEPFERFLLIQSLWDNTMAEEALVARLIEDGKRQQSGSSARSGPMLVLAGTGHVRNGYGIAHRLRQRSPGARILSILPFSGALPENGSADMFYYSPMPASSPSPAGQRPSGAGSR